MVLVGFKTEVLDGIKLLQRAFELSKIIFEANAVSSLATEKLDENSVTNSRLSIVLKGTTSLKPEQFMNKIKYFEKVIHERYPQRYFSAWLLTLEDQVILSPELVLPHPRLALDNTILHLATEVSSAYIHPILNLTLEDLSKKTGIKKFEFMTQGRAILSSALKDATE